jgi:DNA-binding protein
MSEDQNVVYIGRKPVMSYVLAVITHLNTPNAKEVVLKARGRAITTAVDTAEVTRRRFMKDLAVEKISIATEELPQELGGTRAVSTIEITLSRSVEMEMEKGEEGKEAVKSNSSLKLTAIKGVGEDRAEKLRAGGVNSIKDLANSDPKELSERAQVPEKMLSEWIDQARSLLSG